MLLPDVSPTLPFSLSIPFWVLFPPYPLSSIPVPSRPFCQPLSLTSLSCMTTTSAWIFLTCSKHLSRKLWGRLLAGPRGVASCTAQSALYQSSSCRARIRRGRGDGAQETCSPLLPGSHSGGLGNPSYSITPASLPCPGQSAPGSWTGTLTHQLHGALVSRLSRVWVGLQAQGSVRGQLWRAFIHKPMEAWEEITWY